MKLRFWGPGFLVFILASAFVLHGGQSQPEKLGVRLPSGKVLLSPVLGQPQRTNSFPTALALSPDGRYLAILNNGYGTAESGGQQSIALLDLQTNQLADYPDSGWARGLIKPIFSGSLSAPTASGFTLPSRRSPIPKASCRGARATALQFTDLKRAVPRRSDSSRFRRNRWERTPTLKSLPMTCRLDRPFHIRPDWR